MLEFNAVVKLGLLEFEFWKAGGVQA